MRRGHTLTRRSGDILADDLRTRRFAYERKRAGRRSVADDGGGQIQYTIDSLRVAAAGGADADYTGLTIATVTVKIASPGFTHLLGEQVDVVDHSGCVFELTEADLSGAWGWAVWGAAVSLDEDDPAGTVTAFHWCTDDRCCVAADGA